MEKYGFVYIWRDRKHKRFYIGAHWGKETDGYICSSTWLRNSYKRRSEDFKRRILSRIYTNKTDMFLKEQEWLNLIKKEELGKKYYNLHITVGHWTMYPESVKKIGQRISLSHKSNPNWGEWSKGRIVSEETRSKQRENNRIQFENDEQREMRRQKSKELWADPEYREKTTNAHKGKKQTAEQIEKRTAKIRGRVKTAEEIEKIASKLRGRKHDPELYKKAWETRRKNAKPITEEYIQKQRSRMMGNTYTLGKKYGNYSKDHCENISKAKKLKYLLRQLTEIYDILYS